MSLEKYFAYSKNVELDRLAVVPGCKTAREGRFPALHGDAIRAIFAR